MLICTGQRHRILLHNHLHAIRVLGVLRPPRINGHGHIELGLRNPRDLHDRHLGPAQPSLIHLPLPRRLPPLDGLQLLGARRATPRRPRHHGDVPL